MSSSRLKVHTDADDDEELQARKEWALRNYQYSGVDRSFISKYILGYYWTWIADHCVPTWMAPNLITLLGSLAMVVGAIIAVYHDYTFQRPVSPSICYLFSLLLWFYSTMDNVDGKQARKTKSSSALGEWFDHSCDAIVCTLGLIMQMSVLTLGQQHPFYHDGKGCVKMAVFLTSWYFIIPTWEQFHTRTLHLGLVNAPTEGIIGFCILFWASGYFGPVKLMDGIVWNDYTLAQLVISSLCAHLLCVAIPASTRRVYLIKAKKYEIGKFKFIWETLKEWSGMLACTICAWMWWENPHSLVNDVHFLISFVSSLSLLAALYASQIIYEHLIQINSSPSMFMWPMITLIVGSVMFGNFSPLHFSSLQSWEAWYLILMPLIIIVSCIWHAVRVINEFTSILGIHCFRLSKPKQQTSNHPPPPPYPNATQILLPHDNNKENANSKNPTPKI